MNVKVRVRLKNGEIATLKANIPNEIVEHDHENFDDAVQDGVGDWLDDNGVEYRWFNIVNPNLFPQNLDDHDNDTDPIPSNH